LCPLSIVQVLCFLLHYAMDDKVEQVVVHLKMGRAKVVFNISAETLNIVKIS